MNSSELKDFKTEIENNGYDINEFKLNNIDLTDWKPNQLVAIKGSVTVERESTQKEKNICYWSSNSVGSGFWK